MCVEYAKAPQPARGPSSLSGVLSLILVDFRPADSVLSARKYPIDSWCTPTR
jgi:hypothetical protein